MSPKQVRVLASLVVLSGFLLPVSVQAQTSPAPGAPAPTQQELESAYLDCDQQLGLDPVECLTAIYKAYCVNQPNKSPELIGFCKSLEFTLGPVVGLRTLGKAVESEFKSIAEEIGK